MRQAKAVVTFSSRLRMSTFTRLPSIPTKRLSSAGSVIERKLQGNINVIEMALQEDAEEREDFYRSVYIIRCASHVNTFPLF